MDFHLLFLVITYIIRVFFVFAKDELPRGVALRFRVYPQNTSGKEGRPITSEPITLT